ncbi:hypothetical protein KQH65_03935 [archaeon]|nr:hypothetical protein [archaeon]
MEFLSFFNVEYNLPVKRYGRYCLVNVSDLLDMALVIMLKSSREEIIDLYTDLFPYELSWEDIDSYFMDCESIDDESKKVLLKNIDYIVDKLNISGKWISV